MMPHVVEKQRFVSRFEGLNRGGKVLFGTRFAFSPEDA
jgi:hypothetical protein